MSARFAISILRKLYKCRFGAKVSSNKRVALPKKQDILGNAEKSIFLFTNALANEHRQAVRLIMKGPDKTDFKMIHEV